MAGYMVAQILTVNHLEGWREYSAGVAATVAQYGSRFLVRHIWPAAVGAGTIVAGMGVV